MLSDPILKTKLFIPPVQDDVITRPRLLNRINQNLNKKVLFINAPAGFGKSTLLAEWAEQSELAVSWVSLDRTENEPVNFLSYLIAGVQNVYEGLGDTILSVLQAPGIPPVEKLLYAWINEIAEHTTDFVLILDDFHLIENQDVIDLVCTLTTHQPPQLHLLLASRADLPLSCSRLRARGELMELGIAEMRFTQDEALAYLQKQLGDSINARDAASLMQRTEGWIVGLHMAVLSMKSSEDVRQYVAQFSARDSFITDYLLDEVLLHQSEDIKNFLLATSILEKFTAPLCDAVVGIDNSRAIIAELVQSGLFVIALDTTRTWYRYHHLFAELLQLRLANTRQYDVAALHKRASDWFINTAMLEESISHAFATENYQLVILRIENALSQILEQGKFRQYLSWIDGIPNAYLQKKPRLEIVKIFMLHEMGQIEARDRQAAYVEDLLPALPDSAKTDDQHLIINHGIFAAIKAIIYASSYLLADEAHAHAQLAAQLLPDAYMHWRSLALGTGPFIQRITGNYQDALIGFQEGLEKVLEAKFTFQTFIIYFVLTKSYLETGQLKRAHITCQKAIEMDAGSGVNLPFAKLAYLLMGEIQYHTGKLEAAETLIELGLEQVIGHGDIFSIIDGYGVLVRIQIASGDSEQALTLIQEMKSIISGLEPSRDVVKIVTTWEAYTLIMANRPEKAQKLLGTSGLEFKESDYLFGTAGYSFFGIYRVSQNPIKIYVDFARLTTARLHLATGNLHSGLDVISSALEDMPAGGCTKYKIESLIVKALLYLQINDKHEAADVLAQAIQLAAPEGYVQAFLHEGDGLWDLLGMLKERAGNDIEEQLFILQLLEQMQWQPVQANQRNSHIDQLSPREIEVLSCLATGVSYAEAAHTLSISRNTLKTHTKRIYRKLAVNGLLQAINKAKSLKII
jgi:LuxR family maltose regulon positive regulatory protein